MHRLPALALLLATLLFAQQDYKGPLPPEDNMLYLVQGGSLVATEYTIAQPFETAEGTIFILPGGKSPVQTHSANPTLLVESTSMTVRKLRLFHMEMVDGHRQISIRADGADDDSTLTIGIAQVSGNIYRINVVDTLAPGEYSLSPDGSNDAFCFAVI